MYLYGKRFQLVTDHKALATIFKPDSKPCARIQRWVLRLQSYDFEVIYCEGRNNIADPFSRLYTDSDIETSDFDLNCEVHVCAIVDHSTPIAVNLKEIEDASKNDEEIELMKEAVNCDIWDERIKHLRPFSNDFGFYGEVLLKNNKIVIPKDLQTRILAIGHERHPGSTTMKTKLRSKVWWYKMDTMIENFVKCCTGCRLVAKPSPPIPMTRKILPERPWDEIAIDFCGPLPSNDHLFVIIDYYSRFMEIFVVQHTTACEAINKLKETFYRYGIPKTLRSDNGPAFVAHEFAEFCKVFGVKHNTTIPYWPAMNGEVERQNETIVKKIIISQELKRDWKIDLREYLFMYHTTNHPTTGKSPFELLFNRRARDKLPAIEETFEDSEVRDHDKIIKEKGKEYSDARRHARGSDIKEGDKVLVINLQKQNKLTPTFNPQEHTVMKVSNSGVIVRDDSNGKEYRRYIGHLKKVHEFPTDDLDNEENVSEPATSTVSEEISPENEQERNENEIVPVPVDQNKRVPRKRKIPEKYKDFVTSHNEKRRKM